LWTAWCGGAMTGRALSFKREREGSGCWWLGGIVVDRVFI
jgi:hypothetical protein